MIRNRQKRKGGPGRNLVIILSIILMVNAMWLPVSADERIPESSDAVYDEETTANDAESPAQDGEILADDETDDGPSEEDRGIGEGTEDLPADATGDRPSEEDRDIGEGTEDLPADAAGDGHSEEDRDIGEGTEDLPADETGDDYPEEDAVIDESVQNDPLMSAEPGEEEPPVTKANGDTAEKSGITDWSGLQKALKAGGTVTLTQDIEARKDDDVLKVPKGVTVTLDLNGFEINRNRFYTDPGYLVQESASGGVINNYGDLTIRDSAGGGVITGGFNESNGGGIDNRGTLKLEGGTIKTNISYGVLGGGAIFNSGTLIMSGGTIQNNSARLLFAHDGNGGEGGGIYNREGTVTITGGVIRLNDARKRGGGIYLDNDTDARLYLSGGSVTGNYAVTEGGGIQVSNKASIYLSGSPVVKNNNLEKEGFVYISNNLNLPGSNMINVDGALTAGAEIYVTRDGGDGTGVITDGYSSTNTEPPKKYFRADNEQYGAALYNGEVRIDTIAEGVSYYVRGWNGSEVTKEEKFTDDSVFALPESKGLAAGTYYLNRNVTIDGRVSLKGDTELILGDGFTLDVKGLYIPDGSKLTIYGQAEESGRIYSHPSGGAAIGGYSEHDNGKIEIHGGTIDATGYDHCAGIGSNDGRSGGDITIYGGSITTYSRDGAGIGGGDEGAGGNITIHGGTITSTKVNQGQGARIGGGCDAVGGTVTIDGGTITTTGGSGAGIGGGKRCTDGTVTINGGTITANGGSGAGIGNGEDGSNVAVTLGYTPATRDAISITASSYAGTVTLEQPFTNGILTLGPGAVDNLGHIDNRTLTAATRVVTVKGVTGSFNDKIKLNFYLDIPKTVMEEDSVYVSMRNERTNETKITFVSSRNYDPDKRAYKFSIPLAAKEASDTITASIVGSDDDVIPLIGEKTGSDYTETGVPYSLMEYFNWLEKEGRDANEKAIGKAARDYCTAAQLYFNYNVTEGMSVSDAVRQLSADTLNGYIAVRDGDLPDGVSISGITGMLESDNTLRLYYGFGDGVALNDLTFEIDGDTADLGRRDDGMRYLALDAGTYANHLQDVHEYSASDGTNAYTITASVLTYARSCARKSDEKTSNLGKALYLYNQAAVAAFGTGGQ